MRAHRAFVETYQPDTEGTVIVWDKGDGDLVQGTKQSTLMVPGPRFRMRTSAYPRHADGRADECTAEREKTAHDFDFWGVCTVPRIEVFFSHSNCFAPLIRRSRATRIGLHRLQEKI